MLFFFNNFYYICLLINLYIIYYEPGDELGAGSSFQSTIHPYVILGLKFQLMIPNFHPSGQVDETQIVGVYVKPTGFQT